MKGKGQMGEVVLFLIAMVMMIGAAFLYMKKEDNDFARILEVVKEVKGRLETLEKSQGDVLNAYSQRIDAVGVEIEEMRRKTNSINVRFSNPVPVSLVYKKAQQGVESKAQKTKTPLLERAGVKQTVNEKRGH